MLERKGKLLKFNSKMEILAPVGNWSMLTAAVKAGANAIYFGIK